MNEFDELERLLAAERGASPPPGGAARGWTKLEAALIAGAPSLTVSGAAATQGPGAATAAPLKLALISSGKWGIMGLTLGALAGGGAWVAGRHAESVPVPVPVPASASSRRDPHPPARASGLSGGMPHLTATSEAPRSRATPTELAPPTATSASAPAPSARSRTSAASAGSAGSATESSVASSATSDRARPPTFDEELRLITLAKAELDAGRAHLASVWLAEHASRFPSGVFAVERSALELLIDCGSAPASARSRAQAFVVAHRDSPVVDRVARACGLTRSTDAVPGPNPPKIK